jgi:hypothetical protein
LAQAHQGGRLREWQRPEEHEIGDRKCRRIGANPKCRDQNGRERKAARTVERANGIADPASGGPNDGGAFMMTFERDEP